MEKVNRRFICGGCGETTLPFDVDDEETDYDQQPHLLPPGWFAAEVKRRVANPDYEPPESATEIVNKMLGGLGGGPEQRSQMMGFFMPMAEAKAAEQGELPRTVVETHLLHRCPECAPAVIELDADAFKEEG